VLDQLLLARGGEEDSRAISFRDEGYYITVLISSNSDPRIPDQEIVELVAELDELLFGFGLLGLDHESSIGAEGGQSNAYRRFA
jgi:hypothetical protein